MCKYTMLVVSTFYHIIKIFNVQTRLSLQIRFPRDVQKVFSQQSHDNAYEMVSLRSKLCVSKKSYIICKKGTNEL